MIAWTLYMLGVFLTAKVAMEINKNKSFPFFVHLVTGFMWPAIVLFALFRTLLRIAVTSLPNRA